MPIKTIGYAFLFVVFLVQSLLLGAIPQTVHAEDPPIEQIEIVDPYLLITAVQITGGTGKTADDFIELFNPTSEPFDLNGHRLVKRTAAGTTDSVIKAWTEPTVVPAYHFYLWANSSFVTVMNVPDATSTATLADNNGIALRNGVNDSGEIVDSLAWGSTVNIFENKSSVNPTANESLSRVELFDETSTFVVQGSSPRNSTFEHLPDDSGEEEDEEDDESEQFEVIVKITELLPNPSGSDSGFEKIEIYNEGIGPANLSGYTLDDVATDQTLSTNAFTISNTEVDPGEYATITIPTGYFAMNNSDGDVVTLFDPDNNEVTTVHYEGTTPENKSYSLYSEDEWLWADPTFGEENGEPPVEEEDNEDEDDEDEQDEDGENGDYDNTKLEISEIFPQPPAGGNEFVEIINTGTKTAQLSQVEIYIGERKKTLPEQELEPGEYYVLDQAFLPVQLRNSGQVVILRQSQTVLSAVTYPTAILGTSFAKFEDGFLWTTKPTSGDKNILEIPESVKEVVKKTEPTTVKSSTAKAAAKKTATATSKTTAKPIASVAPVNSEDGTVKGDVTEQQASIAAQSSANQKAPLGKIIAMGAAAVSAGIIALYKLVFTASTE